MNGLVVMGRFQRMWTEEKLVKCESRLGLQLQMPNNYIQPLQLYILAKTKYYALREGRATGFLLMWAEYKALVKTCRTNRSLPRLTKIHS
jgi:hypothetical protein